MARDRLAAQRSQRAASHSDHWSYPSPVAAGFSEPARPPNVYVLSDGRPINMQGRPNVQCALDELSGGHQSHSSPDGQCNNPAVLGNTPEYSNCRIHLGGHVYILLREIIFIQDNLKSFNDNVSRISDLHSLSLNSVDWASSRLLTHQLDNLVKETSTLSSLLKDRIHRIHNVRWHVSGREGQIWKQQTGLVRHKFIEAIQNYQQIEESYRSKYKQRMERQYRVVNPEATSDEIKAVFDDNKGEQLFKQMLQSSNRHGSSRAVLRDVQERHEDVKNIERTLGELSQLFNDLHILVMQDDEAIDGIQTMSTDIEKHTGVALHQTQKAVVSAQGARKKQWICIGIALIIVISFAIAIAILSAQLNNNNA